MRANTFEWHFLARFGIGFASFFLYSVLSDYFRQVTWRAVDIENLIGFSFLSGVVLVVIPWLSRNLSSKRSTSPDK